LLVAVFGLLFESERRTDPVFSDVSGSPCADVRGMTPSCADNCSIVPDRRRSSEIASSAAVIAG
jgi:hypothetical protein